MPCEILVERSARRKAVRGHMLVAKDTPASWGSRENFPVYLKATISDKTAAEMQPFFDLLYDPIADEFTGPRWTVRANAVAEGNPTGFVAWTFVEFETKVTDNL